MDLSRALTAAGAAAILGVAAAPVAAADAWGHDVPFTTTATRTSAHLMVHHRTTGDGAITSAQAAEILARGEAAWAHLTGPLGLPPPRPDADGLLDVYVGRFTTPAGEAHGVTVPDDPLATAGTAWVGLHTDGLGVQRVMAHELAHAVQYGLYAHADPFLVESAAEWAAVQVPGAVPAGAVLPAALHTSAGLPLDGPSTVYGQWPFLMSMGERLGPGVVRETFERAAVLGATDRGGHALQALDDVAARHGSSLAAEFLEYTRRNIGGEYAFAPLTGRGAAADVTVPTVVLRGRPADRPLGTETLTVDHLSARYVAYTSASGTCRPGEELEVRVGLPPGVPTAPVLRRTSVADDVVRTVTPRVSGGTAVFRIPWRSCLDLATLVGPNADRTRDGQVFTVTSRILANLPVMRVATPARARVSARRPVMAVTVRATRRASLVVTALAPGVRTRAGRRLPQTERLNVRTLRPGVNRLQIRLAAPRAGRHRLTFVLKYPGDPHGERIGRAVRWVGVTLGR